MAALLCMSCLRKEEEEVTELDYRHCSLDDVPNEIFAYERTLETLRLDSNNIRDLPRSAKWDYTEQGELEGGRNWDWHKIEDLS